jgi:hypothetical protein
MVSFLSPLFLLGALAAAVPIVLHLLKREPEARIRFSAVRLLRQAPVEHTRRRHLNELLLLLLRVAALVLLAIAFARPFFATGEVSPSASLTVVAVDVSLSTAAPGQFEKARARARQAIDAASSDLVAVVSFADTAQIASRPSADRGLARSAVDALAPGFGGTRYHSAFAAAESLFEGRTGSLVVVSDAQASGWRPGDRAGLPASVRLELADIGAPPPNLAIVGARAAGDRLIAEVRNAGGEARDVRLRATVDGRAAGDALVAVDPGQTADASLPLVAGREAVVTLEDATGAAGDNSWYVLRDATALPTVLVVTTTGDLERDAFYLGRAIAAAGSRGSSYQGEGASTERLSAADRPALERYAAVVVLSTRSLESRGRELIADYVRSGGGVLIAGGPAVDPEVASGMFGGLLTMTAGDGGTRSQIRSLTLGDVRHPIFEAFSGRTASLGLIGFRRIVGLAGTGCQTLARFNSGEPALVDCAAGGGRVLAIGSDLNNSWNDFPLHTTFVPFVHEVVRYLAGTRPRRGDYLVGQLPQGVPAVPGFVDVPTDSGGTIRAAVNVDSAESLPDRLTAGDFDARVARFDDRPAGRGVAAVQQEEERQRVWQYVLGLMVAMLAVESFIGSRTS